MLKKLAQTHVEFGVYGTEIFDVPDSRNIVSSLTSIPELTYLHRFYLEYQLVYKTESQRLKGKGPTTKLTNVSRSVDLPFVGESLVRTGRAKYIFVFEGSLQKPDHLSITVLSCLWPLNDTESHSGIFQTFWPKRRHAYNYIVDRLGINTEIAKQSYVVDAVRTATKEHKQDVRRNRALLEREIDLLDPELVVLVGGTARRTVGEKALRERGSLYFNVPFPMKWKAKRNLLKANERYRELQKLLGHLTSRSS